jgi:hypothetical protein
MEGKEDFGTEVIAVWETCLEKYREARPTFYLRTASISRRSESVYFLGSSSTKFLLDSFYHIVAQGLIIGEVFRVLDATIGLST